MKIKISAVEYTNTKAFIYGLQHHPIIEEIDLVLDIPSVCAQKVISGQVDIGLMPVAAFPQVPQGHIISDYCIGSDGAVNSVFIFSHLPYSEIKTLRLDTHSRTSNQLCQVLFKFHWKHELRFTFDPLEEVDAIVLIGDRTFGKRHQYAYAYDMGEEWKKFTGLPFMYAAWIANKPISATFQQAFNEALALGLSQRAGIVAGLAQIDGFDMQDYMFNKLQFERSAARMEAMQRFLEYSAAL